MPCEYQIFVDERLVVKTFFGRITYRCVLDLLDRVESDPLYVPGMSELDDLRGVSDLAYTQEEIRRLADLMKSIYRRRQKHTRKATLATDPRIGRAAYDLCKAIEDPPSLRIGVFSDLGEAGSFLGLSAERLSLLAEAPPTLIH